MTRRALAACAALIILLAAGAAFANVRILAQVGDWQAYGGSATNGTRMCGVSTNSGGKYFSVKYFYGDATFTIQMGSNGWRIGNGAKQRLTLRFDSNPPWRATGTGFHFSNGQAGLELSVAKDQLTAFLSEFRASNALRMTFDGNNVSGWWVSLTGSSAVSHVFVQCILALK
jgi:hypothetical protein